MGSGNDEQYDLNGRVLCLYRGLYYEAKIIEVTDIGYKIHYQGWNKKYDEMVRREEVPEKFKKFSEEAQIAAQKEVQEATKVAATNSKKKNEKMSARESKTVRVVRSSVSRESNISQESSGLLDVSGNSSFNSSRAQEKDQLTGLNSRLAQYIERARQLEAENGRLSIHIRDVEEIEKKEKNSLQDRFENEKKRMRFTIEDLEKREARAQVERDTAVADISRLQAKFAKSERELSKAISERDDALARADEAGTRLRAIQARLVQLETDNKELARENARLPQLQKALEDEVLQKTHAQNERNRALEDLEFHKEHHSELEEVSHKRQVDMITYKKEVSQDYQSKLQEQLAVMRAQFQEEIAASNASIVNTYESKLADAQEARDSARNEATTLRSRVKEFEMDSYLVDSLRRELSNKKDELASMEADKNARIDELNREIAHLLDEFRNLRDTKIQLDAELNTYRVLLETEEERLNLTGNSAHNTSVHQTSYSAATSSAKRGTKRRRVDFDGDDDSSRYQRNQLQKETTGPVGIDEVDENAQWVRIANTGDEEVHIGKWKIIVIAGEMEVNFKFNNKMKLGPGQTFAVYSKDSGETPAPQDGIVMKEQIWPTGANPKARLVDAEGDTVSTVSLDVVESDDPENPSERCSIM